MQDEHNEEDILKAHAVVGYKCEEFLQTDVGRLIKGRADQEIAEYTEQLKKADPEDTRLIRDLQNKIYRAESIIEWLQEAIENGQTAYHQLEQPEE